MNVRQHGRHGEFGDAQMRSLGRRLRELREARSWSLKRIAAESGVSVAAIQKIESGGANPSLLTVLLLAEALGEPVDRLIASSRAASAANPFTRGRLPDTSAELTEAALHGRSHARLLVVPARRSVDGLGADAPAFFYVLDGDLRIAFADGGQETLHTGDSLHVAGGLASRCTNLRSRRSRLLHIVDRREPAERSPEPA